MNKKITNLMLIGTIYKDIISDNTNIKHGEGRAIRAEFLYSAETKLVFLQLSYWIWIGFRKQLKIHTKRKEKGQENDTLQK